MTVLICGAGIGGLCLGLSLQQLNIPFQIFESTESVKPLGVGINLQPNAVRELYALGVESDLKRIGVQTEEFGLFSKKGLEIWTEHRGLKAGYNVPQFSVHRGELQKLLYGTLIERMENNVVNLGMKVICCDGHDHKKLYEVLKTKYDFPTVIIAETIKGKGVSFMENSVLWHYRSPSKEDLSKAFNELS